MALNINGTTGISGVDGSASAPALQGSDSNTGVSFASDTVNINTGGSTRATVDSSGKLLVGRTSTVVIDSGSNPSDHSIEQLTNNSYALGLNAAQTDKRGLGIYYPSGGNAHVFILCNVGGTNKFYIAGSGNVSNANNSYGAISDVSLKENIVDAKSQWDDIKNIKVRNYNFKESTGHSTHTQLGVIAQELETVCPKIVDTGEDGNKTVSYSVLYMKAIKALQEAIAKIEVLETKVAALEAV